MLRGSVTLTLPDSTSHRYTLKGYDINGVFEFLVSAETTTSQLILDSGFTFANGTHGVDSWGNGIVARVALGNIQVQKIFAIDNTQGTADIDTLSEDDFKKLPKAVNNINKEYWAIIGSVIRGMRSGCIPVNRSDYEEISDNFSDLNSTITYNVSGGSVELLNSNVKSMQYEGVFNGVGVSLNLYEDGSTYLKIPFIAEVHRTIISTSWIYNDLDIDEVEVYADDSFYSIDQIVTRNKGRKSYEWLLKSNYEIVTPETFLSAVKEIYNHGKNGGLIAFDTETTGLFISNQSKQGVGDSLVGMVFSIREGHAWYFPVGHREFDNIGSEAQVPLLIDKYIKPILERFRILTHNGSFDWKVMHIYGINTNIVADTRIAAVLTVSHLSSDANESTGLKYLTGKYLHRDSLELDDFVEGGWGTTGLTFADLPKESVRYYACADTDNTLCIWNVFERENILDMFDARKELEIECLFTRAVGYSEFYGMYSNPDSVHELGEELIKERSELEERLYKIAGRQFKITSPKEKNDILFKQLKVPVVKEGKTGPSADKKSLKTALKMLPEDSPAAEFIKNLLEFQVINQLYNNFVTSYDKYNKKIQRPNFVNAFSYSQVSQFLATGRLSVSNPNYQSFNDSVKKYITARKGYYVCDFDFSAIEYRTLVSIAGETALIEKFFDPDYDYHRSMASMLYGIPYDEVTPKLRSQSKGLNFGIPYGMSIASLANTMGVDVETATVLYNKYFEVQPKVKEFFEQQKTFAVENMYNKTFFGRRRTYDKRRDNINRIRRQSGNHPIQGTAADIYKLGIGRLFLKIMEKGYMGKVLISAFVHDEAVIECHNSINPAELLAMVQEALMIKIEGWCPLYIGCGFGESWYDAKKIELPVQVQNSIIERKELSWWDGDTSKLKNWALSEIINFKVNYIKDYLADSENHNKPLNSVSFGHLSEVLDMISSNTALEDNPQLVDEGVGIAYTDTMKEYTYHRSDVITNLKEFGVLFGCDKLVSEANIRNPETVTAETPQGTAKRGVLDVQLTEEDPVDIAIEKALLNGVAVEENSNCVFLSYYPEARGSFKELWKNKSVQLLREATEGDYKVYMLEVTGELEDNVKLRETKFSISRGSTVPLFRAYSQLRNLALIGA